MRDHPVHVAPQDRERVIACLRDVGRARAGLTAARLRPERTWDKSALRADLLESLERYASAIAKVGAPVPRQLREEIRLYRALRHRA